ncbi:tyrosine-type recombinase/integrase [Kocuria palustris]|uniref:tyrosine-type recombinase/integrase n=1 Tax=Kocuria palustris TaxID=71999 RepID=UPI00128ECD51|nr:site-specific integrase [Kocuria palustris]
MPTERDAAELRDFLNANGNSFALAAQSASRLRSSSPTVDAVIAAHIDQLTAIAPGTRRRYRRMAARHITPVLGAVPLDTLTRRDVASWLNGMTGSAKTKRNVQSVLPAALSSAVRDGIVPTNVAKGVQPPRGESRTEAVFLSREEAATIVEALPPRYQLLAGTGLRWGEATALEVRDITLTGDPGERAGTVSVTKAWRTGESGPVVGAPKTARSRRTVTLPRALAERIAEHIADAPDRGALGVGDLLLTNAPGRPIRNWVFHGHTWGPALDALEEAGALRARPRIHDLRHTHASWLIAAGVPLTVIQRRLGHESIKTTSDRYGHLADDADALAAAAPD